MLWDFLELEFHPLAPFLQGYSFYLKKSENCTLLKISLICAKGFLDSHFNEAVTDKISIFHEIVPNFTYSQEFKFLR